MMYITREDAIGPRSYLEDHNATVSGNSFSISSGQNEYLPTVLSSANDQMVEEAGKQILNVYARNGSGSVDPSSRYAIDVIIANTLQIPLDEAVKRHDMFVHSFTGERLEDRSITEAFAKSWEADGISRQIAQWQNDFTDSEDPEEKAELRKRIEEGQMKLVKLQDYSSRSWLGRGFVQSAPLFKQVAEMALWSLGGSAIGSGIALAAQGIKNGALVAKLISKGYSLSKIGSKAANAGYYMSVLYPTMKGQADLQLYNILDADENRMDDRTRDRASSLIALAQVAVDMLSPQAAFSKYIGIVDVPEFVTSHFKNRFLQGAVRAGMGALSESFEEGTEDFIYSIGEALAQNYSNTHKDTSFDVAGAGEVIGNALVNAANTFSETFLPSLIVGGAGATLEGTFHHFMSPYYSELDATPDQVEQARTMQSFTDRSKVVVDSRIRMKRRAPSESFMSTISTFSESGERVINDKELPPVKVREEIRHGAVYYVPIDDYNSDLAKYLKNKGQEYMAIDVVSQTETISTPDDMRNLAAMHDAGFDPETETIYVTDDILTSLSSQLQEEEIDLASDADGNLTFSYREEDGTEHTVTIVNDPESREQYRVSISEETDEEIFESPESETPRATPQNQMRTQAVSVTGRETPSAEPVSDTGTSETRQDPDITGMSDSRTNAQVRERRERIATAIRKATKGNINPTAARTLASLFDYMPEDARKAILSESPDGNFVINEKELNERFGTRLGNNRGATLIDRLKMVLSPRSAADTVVHESVHLIGHANPQLFADLAEAYLDVITDPDESENLRTFLDENRKIIKTEADAAMEMLSALPEDGNFSEKQEELVSNVLVAAMRAFNEGEGTTLPARLMEVFRNVARLVRNFYNTITGRTELPAKLMDAYGRFFDSEGYGETSTGPSERASFHNNVRESETESERGVRLRYQANDSADLTETRNEPGSQKRYQSVTRKQLDQMLENGVYVPNYVIDYKINETSPTGAHPDAEFHQKLLDERAMRDLMKTIPRPLLKLAREADTAEDFIRDVEEKRRKDHKRLPDDQEKELLRKYFSYINTPTGMEMIRNFRLTFNNREAILDLKRTIVSAPVTRTVRRDRNGKLVASREKTFSAPLSEAARKLGRLSRSSSDEEFNAVISDIARNTVPYLTEYYRALARKGQSLPFGFRNAADLINLLYMQDDDYDFLKQTMNNRGLFDEFGDDVFDAATGLGDDVRDSVTSLLDQTLAESEKIDLNIHRNDIPKTIENFKKTRELLRKAMESLESLQSDYDDAVDFVSNTWIDRELQEAVIKNAPVSKIQELSGKITEEAEALYKEHPGLRSGDAEGRQSRASRTIDSNLPSGDQMEQLLVKYQAYLSDLSKLRVEDVRKEYRDRIDRERERSDKRLETAERNFREEKEAQRDKLWEKIRDERYKANMYRISFNRAQRRYDTLLKNVLDDRVNRSIKRKLSFNNATHDVELSDTVLWLYTYMHDGQHRLYSNSETFSDADRDMLNYANGLAGGEDYDVLMWKLDSDGNPVDGISSFEGNLGAFSFDQNDIPVLLASELEDSLAEAIRTKRYSELTYSEKRALNDALTIARRRARDKYQAVREARVRDLRDRENAMAANLFGSDFINVTTERDIETVRKKIPNRDWDNMSEDEISAIVQDYKRRHPGLFFVAREDYGTGLLESFRKTKDTLYLAGVMIEPFLRKLDGKMHGVFQQEFMDKPMRAYQDKIRETTRRINEATEMFDSTLGARKSEQRNANISWLKEVHEGFTYNNKKKNKRTMTGSQLLGAYIYMQNRNGLRKLYAWDGNNMSLDTLAKINPEALAREIRYELQLRADFEADRLYRESRGLVPQEYPSTLLALEDEAKLRSLLSDIEEQRITSVIPDAIRATGDGMIALLRKEQQRYAKVVYDVYNEKMIFQENYFPLVADGRMSPGKDVGEKKGKASSMPFAGNKEAREVDVDYPLMLDPFATFLSAIETQENFINMSKPIRNLNSIMSDHGGGMRGLIRNKFGEKYAKYLQSYIERLAGGNVTLSDIDRLSNRILGNVAVSKIALNLMTSVKQLVSVIPAITDGEISVGNFASSLVEIANGKDAIYDQVDMHAPEILHSQINPEYQRLRDATAGNPLSENLNAWRSLGMKPVEAVDQFVKVAVWNAAFKKNIGKGLSVEDSASRASALVQRTQSMSDPFSITEIQANKSPFARAFFLFTNDLFHMWNIMYGHAWLDWQEGNRLNAVRRWAGAVASSALLACFAMGWVPEDDDDDEFFDKEGFRNDFLVQMMQYMTPGLGHLWQNAISGYPRETWSGMQEIAQSARMVYHGLAGDREYTAEEVFNQIWDVASEGLSLAGLPVITAERGVKVFYPEYGGSLTFNPGYIFGNRPGDAIDSWFGLNDLLD